MTNKEITDDLVDDILNWWEEHQWDCNASDNGDYIEDYNVYDDEPSFVKKAKLIKGLRIKLT